MFKILKKRRIVLNFNNSGDSEVTRKKTMAQIDQRSDVSAVSPLRTSGA
jgi:hypothetical protein